jgi:PPOX class probable F420-dependent enzyme
VASRRARIELDEAGRRALMDEARTLVLGTVGPDGRPHLVPMWFVLDDEGRPCCTSYARAQKVRNIERDDRVTALVEAGEGYDELRGIAIDGRAELIAGDPERTRAVMEAIGRRYGAAASPEAARPARQAPKRVVIRIHPERVRSWDHRRLGAASG